MFCDLLIKALGIIETMRSELLAIKGYYWHIGTLAHWDIGTHYYSPLSDKYKTREEFIREAQHPIPNGHNGHNGHNVPNVPYGHNGHNVLVVGEVVSLHQGWVNGALESVQAVLTKKWINSDTIL